MDARTIVENDIKSYINKALKLGILTNPRTSGQFYEDRMIISSKYTRFADEADYLKNYYKKYEQGEYLATLEDGAYLQINYEFDIRSRNKSYLKKMNLCYLPPVIDGKIENEYIRIDYCNSNDNSFFHAYAHVHIGFRNAIRIPIDEVLLFSEFLAMILYCFYPSQFKELFSDCKTSNTIDKSISGKLTDDKVLTKELEKFIYLKTIID